jgi:hypothetical protein
MNPWHTFELFDHMGNHCVFVHADLDKNRFTKDDGSLSASRTKRGQPASVRRAASAPAKQKTPPGAAQSAAAQQHAGPVCSAVEEEEKYRRGTDVFGAIQCLVAAGCAQLNLSTKTLTKKVSGKLFMIMNIVCIYILGANCGGCAHMYMCAEPSDDRAVSDAEPARELC